MIGFIGDVHDLLDPLRTLVERVSPRVRTLVQVGDLWVWPHEDDVPSLADGTPRPMPRRPRDPSLHWRRATRDLSFIDGNHHVYPLTNGLTTPTTVAPGLRFLPRGTVATLEGRDGPLRVGFLGGADSVIDAAWRRPDEDWWPEDERVSAADVDRLLTNARAVGGLDLLVTHTPPASVTDEMTQRRHPPHPSAVLVEEAWRALGGGETDPPLELICGHMHEAWIDETKRVEVLDFLGYTER